jgi:drug/metabolite transporter (DMT)-like permease
MSRPSATMTGLAAVLLWATLAPLTVLASGVPPFQLVAMSFTVGASIGAAYLIVRPTSRRELRRVTPSAALLGLAGLLGYHFLYFLGLSLAPPLEANLVNYLWPLLIVLFSALLPQAESRLRAHHILGATVAFAGAVLVITKGDIAVLAAIAVSLAGGESTPALSPATLTGYAATLGAAVTWASYSVLSRLFADVPSSAVTIYCAATAVAGAAAHFALETSVWPLTATQWLAVLGLGLGPVGLAFYVWDHGCKHGDLRILGASAYFAPLLSSGLLILFGMGEASAVLWLAAVAITAGALIASKDIILCKSPAGDRLEAGA